MDVNDHNRRAWNHYAKKENRWTIPSDAQAISEARRGNWRIFLTPLLPVPEPWFCGIRDHETIAGCDVLALAGSGGQQAPILAAAGAQVTVFDQSDEQLSRDREVAERESLELKIIQGDMADLGCFADESFDLIVNPTSTCFVDELPPVWRECHRVLRPGGRLMTGFCMPSMYIFDREKQDQGELVVRYRLPYSDVKDLTSGELQKFIDDGEPLEFSHSLDIQIGELLRSGFHLIDFFEDKWDVKDILSEHFPPFASSLALKPASH